MSSNSSKFFDHTKIRVRRVLQSRHICQKLSVPDHLTSASGHSYANMVARSFAVFRQEQIAGREIGRERKPKLLLLVEPAQPMDVKLILPKTFRISHSHQEVVD